MNNATRKRCLVHVYQLQISISHRQAGRRMACPLHRNFTSPHAYGGALYSVTCSQRKYLTRMCFVAGSSAMAVYGVGVDRSILGSFTSFLSEGLPGAPAVWLHTYGMYLIALFTFQRTDYQPAGAHHKL